MPPQLRKLALTAHVSCSVGWLGAVAAFVPIAVVGIDGKEAQAVGWFVLVPLSFASLLTGLISSLGTEWGLFRHWWVVSKLALNLFGCGGLLEFMLRLDSSRGGMAPMGGRRDMVVRSGLALAVLLVPVVLSVYKPRGVTPYGWRKQRQRRMVAMRQRRDPAK